MPTKNKRDKKQPFGFAQVVQVVELDPIEAAEGPALRLRLEVIQRGDRFSVQAFRRELFHLRPMAGAAKQADESVLVADNGIDWDVDASTAAKALKKALARLKEQLGR